MNLHFFGANRQITGSRYCLEVGDRRVMVDCGLFQEREYQERNWETCPLPADSIDALILTHAHIDHCGLVPRLVRFGFRGPIYATPPTADLLNLMWMDSARIQAEDARYKRKRHQKGGRQAPHDYEPLYDENDAILSLKQVEPVPYCSAKEILPGIQVTFHDAGHILGSASIELVVHHQQRATTIIFSGDIGQSQKPLLRDPTLFTAADYVIMESTYGDRDHPDGGDIATQLATAIVDTVARGGKVLIPTFALERAQELIYHLGELVRDSRIPEIPIILDSPMAVDATEIFRQHRDALDSETWRLIAAGTPPLRLNNLAFSRTVEDSKGINDIEGPAVIMATSGMCTAGRIKHHLRQHIEDPRTTVLFVGFQAHGTLGRQILDRRPEVRIHGRNYKVKAQVEQILGFSGHADRSGLLRWQGSFTQPPRELFITHGEEAVALDLAKTIADKGWKTSVPTYKSVVQLDP